MWALLNDTPYGAERTWTRDRDGRHLWIVAIKATYDIDEAGALRLADEQPPPLLEPVHFGDPRSSSVRYDAEVVEPKPATDVIINATAYAPHGKPARTVEVAARIHGREKTLLVHGPRVFQRSGGGVTPSGPEPFTRHPIVYEWAYGGHDLGGADPRRHVVDLRNPVGRGVAARIADLVDTPAFRVAYPRSSSEPAGFGAIAIHWSPRRELAGTYDDAWSRTRRPLLPADYDARARLCSPVDQRPAGHLVGGEHIALRNMTPGGSLAFTIPRVSLDFTTHFRELKALHHGTLGTVVVEPDLGRVSLVWQTSLIVGPRDLDNLDATVIREEPA